MSEIKISNIGENWGAVTSYTHALRSLSAILTKAEALCVDRKIDPNAVFAARLFPDMLNFNRGCKTEEST